MPQIDISNLPRRVGADYPTPYAEPCSGRSRQALAGSALTDFGVNLTELAPGSWSSQRHWHSEEDEFVYVVSGEVVLCTDSGDTTLRVGDFAAFPKNQANGHHLINRSDAPTSYLEMGSRSAHDVCRYPDIDLLHEKNQPGYRHRDGTPYPSMG